MDGSPAAEVDEVAGGPHGLIELVDLPVQAGGLSRQGCHESVDGCGLRRRRLQPARIPLGRWRARSSSVR